MAKKKWTRTTYKPEYVQALYEYFKPQATEKVITAYGMGKKKVEIHPVELPTKAGFCVSIGTSRRTVYEWLKARDEEGNFKHPEFREAWDYATDVQEKILAANALAGRYNASFSIFAAKNMLRWRDKQEHEIKAPEPLDVQVTYVRAKNGRPEEDAD